MVSSTSAPSGRWTVSYSSIQPARTDLAELVVPAASAAADGHVHLHLHHAASRGRSAISCW